MPALGGTSDNNRGNHAASAYPQRSSSASFAMLRIISLILTFSIIRNMMTKDYRTGEIDYLRKSGFDEEQISKYIPETNTEIHSKLRKKRTEYEQMKIDLLVLQEQMKEVRKQVGIVDDIAVDKKKEIDKIVSSKNEKEDDKSQEVSSNTVKSDTKETKLKTH